MFYRQRHHYVGSVMSNCQYSRETDMLYFHCAPLKLVPCLLLFSMYKPWFEQCVQTNFRKRVNTTPFVDFSLFYNCTTTRIIANYA